MKKKISIIIPCLFTFYLSNADSSLLKKDTTGVRVLCSEKEKKNNDGKDPIILKTCFLKNFKIISTGYPDYKGRYTYEYKVYRMVNGKYISSSNSNLFNKTQNKLLQIINQRIQKDFKDYSTSPDTKDCFIGIDTIPNYKMNDLRISFDRNEVRFSIEFGLSSACLNVGGTIVDFKISEIEKYLK